MNRKLYISIFIIVLFILYLCSMLFVNRIDTKYAVDFSNVFSTYDINSIDSYLSNETIIICNNKYAKYAELRKNVKVACEERKYQFESSYGHGNNKFKNNVQEITVYLYGKLNEQNLNEVNVLMCLKKAGWFKYEIASLECDDDIFEYLFYGNK